MLGVQLKVSGTMGVFDVDPRKDGQDEKDNRSRLSLRFCYV